MNLQRKGQFITETEIKVLKERIENTLIALNVPESVAKAVTFGDILKVNLAIDSSKSDASSKIDETHLDSCRKVLLHLTISMMTMRHLDTIEYD